MERYSGSSDVLRLNERCRGVFVRRRAAEHSSHLRSRVLADLLQLLDEQSRVDLCHGGQEGCEVLLAGRRCEIRESASSVGAREAEGQPTSHHASHAMAQGAEALRSSNGDVEQSSAKGRATRSGSPNRVKCNPVSPPFLVNLVGALRAVERIGACMAECVSAPEPVKLDSEQAHHSRRPARR